MCQAVDLLKYGKKIGSMAKSSEITKILVVWCLGSLWRCLLPLAKGIIITIFFGISTNLFEISMRECHRWAVLKFVLLQPPTSHFSTFLEKLSFPEPTIFFKFPKTNIKKKTREPEDDRYPSKRPVETAEAVQTS